METKRVILARFVDFDVTPTNVIMATRCLKNNIFVEKFREN